MGFVSCLETYGNLQTCCSSAALTIILEAIKCEVLEKSKCQWALLTERGIRLQVSWFIGVEVRKEGRESVKN